VLLWTAAHNDIALEGTVHTDVPNKLLVVLSQSQKGSNEDQ
jgi:hypothetical protein